MANHCRRIVTIAPWRRLLVQQNYPARQFWNSQRAGDFRSMFRDMERSMEKIEKEFVDNFPFRGLKPRIIPIKGVAQSTGVYRLNIDVDGFNPEEINVSLKNNILTISGKMERTGEDGSKYTQEFTREMTVPDNVDATQLKSYLGQNGIMRLEAPYKSTPEDDTSQEVPVKRE